MQTSGVALDLGEGNHCMIYAKLGQLLSDGDGLRIAMQWMGQAALKPCWRHLNVVKKGSELVSTNASYVEISCSESTKFNSWKEKDFREAIDLVVEAHARRSRGTLTAARLDAYQKTFGFRATADGLLASTTLRSLTPFLEVIRYDWVHVFLADGIVTGEAWRVVETASHINICNQHDVSTFLKVAWQMPRHRRGQGRAL